MQKYLPGTSISIFITKLDHYKIHFRGVIRICVVPNKKKNNWSTYFDPGYDLFAGDGSNDIGARPEEERTTNSYVPK